MASWMSNFLQYLGLAPDDEYPEYDAYDDPAGPESKAAAPMPGPIRTAGGSLRVDHEPPGSVASVGAVRPLTPEPMAESPSVVPLQRAAQAKVLAPTSFAQAQEVADHFKDDLPVALDLEAVDSDLSRRLIDFSSGLCYALGGKMEKLDHQLFLLIPATVTVSPDDRRRLADRVGS